MNNSEQAAYLYISGHKTYREIGVLLGVSPASVSNWLKKQGVTREMGTWPTVRCLFCGKDFQVRRSRVQAKNYCGQACYHAVRQQRPYVADRQGQRIARATVSQYFALEANHVVHHEDGDNRHNELANLKVFASQSDHMAYHHGSPVTPLWTANSTPLAATLENK